MVTLCPLDRPQDRRIAEFVKDWRPEENTIQREQEVKRAAVGAPESYPNFFLSLTFVLQLGGARFAILKARVDSRRCSL